MLYTAMENIPCRLGYLSQDSAHWALGSDAALGLFLYDSQLRMRFIFVKGGKQIQHTWDTRQRHCMSLQSLKTTILPLMGKHGPFLL